MALTLPSSKTLPRTRKLGLPSLAGVGTGSERLDFSQANYACLTRAQWREKRDAAGWPTRLESGGSLRPSRYSYGRSPGQGHLGLVAGVARSPEPGTGRSLRSASPAAQELLTPLTPPTARRLEARSQSWAAEANQKQQWAKELAGLSFLRKEEAEVTLGTGGGNHGAAGEGRSCRCRRCREPRR